MYRWDMSSTSYFRIGRVAEADGYEQHARGHDIDAMVRYKHAVVSPHDQECRINLYKRSHQNQQPSEAGVRRDSGPKLIQGGP
jgi:hypothetical protein